MNLTRLVTYVLFPKPGWFILHALAVALLFLLGYSIEFGKP
jgi:hypothetical protein